MHFSLLWDYTMSDEHHSGLLYGLEQRIPPLPAFFSALQHVLAGLVGIITPPLIIGATLGLGDWLPYLISMSLLASGIGTFLQSNRVWGVGAGMICMQGTSFAFLGVTVAGGMWVKAQGGGPQDMMAMLFGVNFVAALVPVIVSRFIEPLKKIFTPIITGSVIALIGISLIKVSVINWCGGEKAEDFASMSNIALGAGTLGVIVLLSCAKNRWLRLSSVVVGIAVGCVAAGLSGQFHLHSLGDTLFRLPTLFPFGFQFNSAIFLPVALVSLVCILEAVGDLTASACLAMNEIVKDSPGVYYQSVGSKLNKAADGQFPLNFSYKLVKYFDGPNDGLVADESFPWGSRYQMLVTAGERGISHGDMVDLNRENLVDFDVREFYVQLVSRLRRMGF